MVFQLEKAHIWQKMLFLGQINSIFQGARLLFQSNVPGGTFIPEGTLIPYSRVSTYSSGPNNHVVPYNHVGWTISLNLIVMWSQLIMWGRFFPQSVKNPLH